MKGDHYYHLHHLHYIVPINSKKKKREDPCILGTLLRMKWGTASLIPSPQGAYTSNQACLWGLAAKKTWAHLPNQLNWCDHLGLHTKDDMGTRRGSSYFSMSSHSNISQTLLTC